MGTRRPRLPAAAAPAVLLMLAVSACSTGGSGASNGSGTVHLTYAQWMTPETPGYQASINEFEKAHPNVKVTIETFPYTEYQPKLTTQFSSGGGPDVYWVNTPMIASWRKDGVMQDLTSRIRSASIDMSQYLSTLVQLHTFSGRMYGLPKDWDTIAYFYNADYFQQHNVAVPSSLAWDPATGGTWLSFLRSLTYDTAGHSALSPDFNPSAVATYGTTVPNEMQWGFEPFLAENGVKLIGAPYAKTVSFDSAAGKQTFQFLGDLMYRYHVAAPGAALGTDGAANNGEDQTLFAQGKVATIEGGDWEMAGLQQQVKFKLGVMLAPCGPQGCWTVLNGLIDAINAHSPQQEAAWQLEQWLGSQASERILGSGGYVWPGIGSLDSLFAASWKSRAVDPTPFQTEATWNVVYWPVTPGMNQAQLDIANQLAPAYLNGGSVAQAVDAAARQANGDLATAG